MAKDICTPFIEGICIYLLTIYIKKKDNKSLQKEQIQAVRKKKQNPNCVIFFQHHDLCLHKTMNDIAALMHEGDIGGDL